MGDDGVIVALQELRIITLGKKRLAARLLDARANQILQRPDRQAWRPKPPQLPRFVPPDEAYRRGRVARRQQPVDGRGPLDGDVGRTEPAVLPVDTVPLQGHQLRRGGPSVPGHPTSEGEQRPPD